MAHKTGRKLKKLSIKNIGTGKNFDVFKKMNFGDYATILGAGLGVGGFFGLGANLPGIGGLMGKLGGLRTGLGTYAKNLIGGGGVTDIVADTAIDKAKDPSLWDKLGGWGTAKGLLGLGMAGGMGGQPMQEYPDFTGDPSFQQLQGDVDWMRNRRDDMLDPTSAYNQRLAGESADMIGFQNTLGARNAAAQGLAPGSGITMANANANMSRGMDQFYGNIEKRMPQAFSMGQSLIGPQRGMFEDIQNRNIANIGMQNQQNAMNNMYAQQFGYGLLNNWLE